MVPFWAPHYGPHLGTTRIVYSENGVQKAALFWGSFLKLFCFFQLFLKSGGLDGRDGGCGGGGGGEGGGGGVCRIC